MPFIALSCDRHPATKRDAHLLPLKTGSPVDVSNFGNSAEEAYTTKESVHIPLPPILVEEPPLNDNRAPRKHEHMAAGVSRICSTVTAEEPHQSSSWRPLFLSVTATGVPLRKRLKTSWADPQGKDLAALASKNGTIRPTDNGDLPQPCLPNPLGRCAIFYAR